MHEKNLNPFINAVLNKNILAIEKLLDDNGEFEVMKTDKDNNIKAIPYDKFRTPIIVNKDRFLNWIADRFLETETIETASNCKVECKSCFIGQKITLFNNGTFPYNQNNTQGEQCGIALGYSDNKINLIRACNNFTVCNKPVSNEYKRRFEKYKAIGEAKYSSDTFTIKGKDENGNLINLGSLPTKEPKDLYIYRDGKKYLNDKYF